MDNTDQFVIGKDGMAVFINAMDAVTAKGSSGIPGFLEGIPAAAQTFCIAVLMLRFQRIADAIRMYGVFVVRTELLCGIVAKEGDTDVVLVSPLQLVNKVLQLAVNHDNTSF